MKYILCFLLGTYLSFGQINLYQKNDCLANADILSIGDWKRDFGIGLSALLNLNALFNDNNVLRITSTLLTPGAKAYTTLSGLKVGGRYEARIRCRRLLGDGFIGGWLGVINASYMFSFVGSNWIDGRVLFTASEPTITINVNPHGSLLGIMEIRSIEVFEYTGKNKRMVIKFQKT